MASQRKRGSLSDVITLFEFPFDYEPEIKDKESTGYALREIFGNRLPSALWIGQGSTAVDLAVFLVGDADTLQQIQNFKTLKEPQNDIGAPHPVYINLGGIYTGRQFLMVEIETRYTVLDYSDQMLPQEAYLLLKFVEIPVNNGLSGTGF